GLDPVGRPARVPGLSGLSAPPGPAHNVPSPGMHRVEGSEGARRTAGGNAEHDLDPAARGQLRRRHADELGPDRRADAAQLDAPSVCRDRPLRDTRVTLRPTGVRVVPRDTERAAHGLRCEGQATDVRTGAARAHGHAGLTRARTRRSRVRSTRTSRPSNAATRTTARRACSPPWANGTEDQQLPGRAPVASHRLALTCKNAPGAGAENRTRTISLGSLWRCIAASC